MKNILLIEDEAHMRRLLQFILQKTGHRVALAGSGEEALKLAALQPPDLIVTDLTLPEMDGFEAVRQIKAAVSRAKLPVIMLTARGLDELRETANAIGVDAYFTKPFSPSELSKRVTELLG